MLSAKAYYPDSVKLKLSFGLWVSGSGFLSFLPQNPTPITLKFYAIKYVISIKADCL
jgi:hypothetical protein